MYIRRALLTDGKDIARVHVDKFGNRLIKISFQMSS